MQSEDPIAIYEHLCESTRQGHALLKAIKTDAPSLASARSAGELVERLADLPNERTDRMYQGPSGNYYRGQFRCIVEPLRSTARELQESIVKDAISGAWRQVHLYSDVFENVLNAFTDVLAGAHENPIIAEWANNLLRIPAQGIQSQDGPLQDRIGFCYAGVVFDSGLEPIAWRFLKALHWRMGEYVNARDIYKVVWRDNVPEDVLDDSSDELLTEQQAKDVVAKANAFFRANGPIPMHATQNATTGVRVFALLEGPPLTSLAPKKKKSRRNR